jgi:DNA modification methylase
LVYEVRGMMRQEGKMDGWTIDLMLGDCLEMLKELDDNSVDSIVTDPPYGLSKEPDMTEVLRHWLAGDDYVHKGKGFMGKSWDSFVPGPSIWRECLRVLKPGGHLLAFFGTRTHDMGTLAIRLAGFEVRDTVMWVYGSGFPKSMDVSKAIDKALGAERVPTGRVKPGHEGFANRGNMSSVQSLKGTLGGEGGFARPWMDDPEKVEAYHQETAPGSPEAAQWQGWGTALKPAVEPITVARKPLIGTVAANVLEWGTGALNIDGCRVPTDPAVDDPRLGGAGTWNTGKMAKNVYEGGYAGEIVGSSPLGRWPANICHDGSDEVLALFPDSKGQQGDVRGTEASRTGGDGTNCYGEYGRVPAAKRGDSGSAARFFYCAKTSKKDRNEGLPPGANRHETVKPTDLMAYLCRLVTPPGGIVLDPFMGSGSTGKAAMREGFRFIGIERDEAYFDIAEARIMAAKKA